MSSKKSNTIPSEISPSDVHVETLTIHWSPTDTRCYVCTNMDHTDIGIMVEDYKHVWSTFDPDAGYGNSNLVDDLSKHRTFKSNSVLWVRFIIQQLLLLTISSPDTDLSDRETIDKLKVD
jgi:hypothetical protein